MKRYYYPFIIGLFYLPIILEAQSLKGFKLLEKRKTEKAEKVFTKALNKVSQRDAAVYGLYKLNIKHYRDEKEFRNLYTPYQKIEQALEGFKQLPEKNLQRFKKRGIYFGDFQNAMISLQNLALKLIEEKDSILALDHYRVNMGKTMSRGVLNRYREIEQQQVRSNYAFNDYQSLLSILLKHDTVALKQGLNLNRKYVYRVLYAHCRDYPFQEFPQSFCRDLPGHWSCQDCYFEEFRDSLNTQKLSSLIHFLYNYPLSNLDQVIIYALEQPINAKWKQQVNSLDSINTVRWAEIQQSIKWMEGAFPPGLSDEELVNLMAQFLPKNAPSNRSYWALKEALNILHQHKAWGLAADLTCFAAPLFPYPNDSTCIPHSGIINKDSMWFANTIHTFLLPDEVVTQRRLNVSSNDSEHSPVLNLEGNVLFFSRLKENDHESGLDIYVSERIDSNWSAARLVTNLAGQNDQVPLALARHGHLMLLQHNKKLCLSSRGANQITWSKPTPVSDLVNNFPWLGRGTISENGEALIFEASLDSFPLLNEGNIDLYLALYDPHSRSWSAPILFNSIINTPWEERTPYLHVDGETLYFTSYGHFGLAEQDLMMSTRLDSTWLNWSVPKPVGKHLNTFQDDFNEGLSISTNGLHAYFGARDAQNKGQDLFRQEMPSYARPKRMKIIKGQIEKYPKSPWIKLVDLKKNQVIDSTRTTANGEYMFLFPDGIATEIMLFADDAELYSTYVEMNLDSLPDLFHMRENPITAAFSEMLANEIPVPVRYLNFANQSDLLDAKAQKELTWMTRFFTKKKMSYLLAGYADKHEPDGSSLSLRRAKSVKFSLSALGLNGERIWLQDFGDTRPANSLKNKIKGKDVGHIEIYLKN